MYFCFLILLLWDLERKKTICLQKAMAQSPWTANDMATARNAGTAGWIFFINFAHVWLQVIAFWGGDLSLYMVWCIFSTRLDPPLLKTSTPFLGVYTFCNICICHCLVVCLLVGWFPYFFGMVEFVWKGQHFQFKTISTLLHHALSKASFWVPPRWSRSEWLLRWQSVLPGRTSGRNPAWSGWAWPGNWSTGWEEGWK